MARVIVNNTFIREIEKDQKGSWLEDGEAIEVDLIPSGLNRCHVIINNKCYTAEIISVSENCKCVEISVNGRSYEVIIKDKLDILTERLGLQTEQETSTGLTITAPMPGLIVQIQVAEGESVIENQPLVVLKAMKMENIIKAPKPGIVEKIFISEGASVEKNQALIQF